MLKQRAIYHNRKACVNTRILTTGDSQQSQSFNFRIGRSTVFIIIQEVCAAVWKALSDIYLKFPKTEEDFKKWQASPSKNGIFKTALKLLMESTFGLTVPKKLALCFTTTKASTA